MPGVSKKLMFAVRGGKRQVVGTLEATNYNLLPHEKAGII
jgi:hypothetical protein